MTKRFLGILALLAVMCVALVGCGGGSDSQEEAVDYTSIYAGSWQLVAIEGEDNDVTEADIQGMKDLGLTVDLTLAEDGTCSLVMFGEDYGKGTWEAKTSTVCEMKMNDESVDITYDPSSSRLSMAQGDEALIFERADDAAASSSSSSSSSASGKLGGSAGTVEDTDYNAFFYGDWEFVEMTATNTDDAISPDEVAALKDAGYVATLTLNSDGTFSIDMFGDPDSTMTGTWEATGETEGTFTFDSAQAGLSYDPSTGRLGIVESNDTLFFERV